MAQKRTRPKSRPQFPLQIVYEDKDLIIIAKQAGLLSVPIPKSRAKNVRDLLNEYMRSQKQKAIIVHRIDRFTSGLMVFAKNKQTHTHLVRQFLAHTPRRIYLTVVRGHPKPAEDELRHYLKLTKRGFRQIAVRNEKEGGSLAVTRYRVIEYLPDAALLEVELETGLKNQIRVQLAEAGYPIVGDRHYVPGEERTPGIDRQALHAYRLGFVHPRTGKYVEFEAEPPQDFADLVRHFRNLKAKD